MTSFPLRVVLPLVCQLPNYGTALTHVCAILFRCTTLTSHIGPFKEKKVSARASLLLLNRSNNSVFSTYVFSSEAAKRALRAGCVFLPCVSLRAPSLIARHRNPLPVSFCLRRPKPSLSWRPTLRSAALRSAPQPSAVLPHPHKAELSAPTAQILVNSETKPHSLGLDGLRLPQFRFFFSFFFFPPVLTTLRWLSVGLNL